MKRWWLLAASVSLVGCMGTVQLDVLQPARVDLGVARTLVVVQTTGRKEACDAVVDELLHQARGEGFFTATDRSAEGALVKVTPELVNVSGGRTPLGAGEIGLKIDLLDWNVQREERPELWDNQHAVILEPARTAYLGKVLLGITAFDREGRTYLAEREFRGDAADGDTAKEAITLSMQMAVRNLVQAVMPRYAVRTVRLDWEDGQQRAALEAAKAGEVDRAASLLRAYLRTHPSHPVAMYNLGALRDAQGYYEEALELYSRALLQSKKDFYLQAKNECVKRVAARQTRAP